MRQYSSVEILIKIFIVSTAQLFYFSKTVRQLKFNSAICITVGHMNITLCLNEMLHVIGLLLMKSNVIGE